MTIKIDGDPRITQLQGPRKANRIQEVPKPEKSQPSDSVQLSADVQQASETERAARVQELKAQVENGTYQPDMNKVAASLLTHIAKGE
ncbi:flagellar biosynthesis anti-sigma factor FlgM [Desulfohalobium retbaense]|uniref:Negative regulator of flagellin synthesis n=1 Tax=Desulfohalobium retbaense (strain ATCC 49708 / DSM 5692 / JCM 16813 / HR100) TaxID=485915 RepID=C8WYY1_DESRD|nr:flagellar biosynthesis anti-sigma factor FlgM [Desulfohalobium retbaense]ACV67897.1 anti-sigma-28 factor, FlgM [Desulfohalobium retbaense DSM 5692]